VHLATTQRNTAAVNPQGFEPVNWGRGVAGCIWIFLFDVIFEESQNRCRARKTVKKKLPEDRRG
jgi:hypothetical protein